MSWRCCLHGGSGQVVVCSTCCQGSNAPNTPLAESIGCDLTFVLVGTCRQCAYDYAADCCAVPCVGPESPRITFEREPQLSCGRRISSPWNTAKHASQSTRLGSSARWRPLFRPIPVLSVMAAKETRVRSGCASTGQPQHQNSNSHPIAPSP